MRAPSRSIGSFRSADKASRYSAMLIGTPGSLQQVSLYNDLSLEVADPMDGLEVRFLFSLFGESRWAREREPFLERLASLLRKMTDDGLFHFLWRHLLLSILLFGHSIAERARG